MMISSRGRYALRVMLDMAKQHSTQNISVRDLAARQNISRKYLESIMTALCGGYRLRRAPEEYTAGEVLRAVEGELAPVSCVTPDGKKCDGACGCIALPFWQGLEQHINTYVDSYTLQDLLTSQQEKKEN